ncbi:VOC family protein [Alphaproteobacteria bacterium]|nr:VOC family protein [Alphaproteobacteria bacterium]
MIQSTIDHIVIGAADLEEATKRIEQFIKADFSSGGKHPLMATHNRLIKLQNSIYMEIISIDPGATMPQSSGHKKRWFSLDSQSTKRRLSLAPQPLCWVAAVDNVEQAVSHCGYNPGKIIEVTRDDLRWRLTVPENGKLSFDGVLPILIEWPNGKNPAARMPESNVCLQQLTLFHPNPKKIKGILSKLNVVGPINIELGEPRIQFSFKTASGKSIVFCEDCLADIQSSS